MADGVVRNKRGDFAEYAEAAGTQLKPNLQGWARRPGRGETYGKTFIEPFHAEIAALYERGNVDKNTKVSPDQVREQLRRSHPGKFCIPGVWALQNAFIALGQKKNAEEEVVFPSALGAVAGLRCLTMCSGPSMSCSLPTPPPSRLPCLPACWLASLLIPASTSK
jgi:hypothetical protein